MFLGPVANAEKQPTIAMAEPTNPDQLISSTVLFNVDVIETTYDCLSPVNAAFSAMHNRQDNITWTDSEWNKAALGTPIQSVSELRMLVCILIFRVLIFY